MSELGRALLDDICENPDDDVPRLVYADWLEEHGQAPRADAIRLGVRRRKLDGVDPSSLRPPQSPGRGSPWGATPWGRRVASPRRGSRP